MCTEKKYSIYLLFIKILKFIPKSKVKVFWFIFLGMIIQAFFETIVIGLIAFFISSISYPDKIMSSKYYLMAKHYFNFAFMESQELLVVVISISLVFIVLLKNLMQGVLKYVSEKLARNIEGFFGESLLKQFLESDYAWHLNQNSANLVLAINWRTYFGNFINQSLQAITSAIITLIILTTLLIVQPKFSFLILLVFGGFSCLFYFKIKKILDNNTIKIRNMKSFCNTEATKTIHGIKDIKVFLKEKFFLSGFKNNVYKLAKLTGIQTVLTNATVWILEIIGFLIIPIILIVMLYIIKLSIADVFKIITLLTVTLWNILPKLNNISSNFSKIRTNIPFMQKVFDFFDESKSSKKIHESINSKIIFNKNIYFENISYIYEPRNIQALNDISCVVKKGKSIGIIGHSGAGKSTFVDILIGLLTPKSGNIYLDGVKLNNNDMDNMRSIIGYVPQNPYIYDGSLAENVAFGIKKDKIDEEHVLEVCKMASINFIDELSSGINTSIGERGMQLSGGQRQRVAIARALYPKPEILIFDEATSSLDHKSEQEIQKTVYSFKGKITLIIIAHRLTTVSECDYLIWFENGKIVQIGEPKDIIDQYTKHNKN